MEKIETQLKKIAPELSMYESQVLWSRIEGSLSPRGKKSPKKSPVRRSLFRAVTAGFVILGLLGGSVITAYASEALPGDALYSTKITLERAQIVLAPVEKKKDLQLAFADRRVKEVAAVLSDIEEDAIGLADPTLMAMSAPSPEVVTMAFALPAGEKPTDDTLVMEAIPTTSITETNTENKGNTRMAKSADLSLEADTAVAVGAPMNATLTQVAPSQTQESAKQQKRWKNLENKKKALAAAIKQLERSRKELQESGATTTSQNVEVVIMNLTELNESGTTPDQMFVEKAKNSEIEVVDVEEKDERDSDDKGGKDEERDQGESAQSTEVEAQGAAVFLSGNTDAGEEVQREVQEVRVRNDERRKRNNNGNRRPTTREKVSREVRIPVCFDVLGRKEELLVLKENLSQYKDRGFVEGKCEQVIARTDTSTSSEEVSEKEEKGILDE